MMKKNILKCSMGQILRTTVLMILMLCTFGVANGQHRKHPPFNPAKFEADLEQFITVNACLSPSQAASFFPVYRQMMKKQRALYFMMLPANKVLSIIKAEEKFHRQIFKKMK